MLSLRSVRKSRVSRARFGDFEFSGPKTYFAILVGSGLESKEAELRWASKPVGGAPELEGVSFMSNFMGDVLEVLGKPPLPRVLVSELAIDNLSIRHIPCGRVLGRSLEVPLKW